MNALMESAIHCFSENGYEGASLRDIACHADVALSTIHMYFGSKSELFQAVCRQAWAEIDEDRSAYLNEALSEGQAATLGTLIHALAYPVVRRALNHNPRDLAQLYILRSHTSSRHRGINPRMAAVADRSMLRWIDAMLECCPSLERQDMVWALSFVIGAIYSWQLIDHRYDTMLGSEADRTVDEVTKDIVAFCSSGIEAIAARRRPTA